MTKIEAIEFLIKDARSGTLTHSGYKRVQKIGKALELTDVEQVHFERMLEYRNYEGKVHEWLEAKRK